MSLIIGFDADGVLTSLYDFNKRCGEKTFNKAVVNKQGYTAREMFGLTKIEEIQFIIKNLGDYCTKEIPPLGCVETLNFFKNEGFEMHAITARVFTRRPIIGKKYQNMFKNWLTKNNINVFKTFNFCTSKHTNEDKYEACSRLKVDIMIDDSPEVSMSLAEKGIKVLLVDAPYNKEVSHENITRCKNYQEIKQNVLMYNEMKISNV